MSLHSDEYIRALQSVQDHVVPFPDEVARREVDRCWENPSPNCSPNSRHT